jgi:precorrin-6A/cobalt-precorrin-6A reductase
VAEFLGVPHIFLLIRLITPPDPPLNLHNGQVLCQRGPFSLSSEQDLLRKYQIDSIVCKNSGGTTDAKLLAARQLGLRVIMRQRPNRPTLPVAFDVPQAVEWLYQRP